jgi:MFS family permease
VAKASVQTMLNRSTPIFYGWWIVAVSLVIDACKHGTFNRGFTLYILPIRNELGLGVTAISLAEMLGRLEGGVLGPVMGYLTDRFGAGAILVFGGLMSGLGFIFLSQTNNLFVFMVIFVGMLSVGFRSGYNNATLAAVNQWFRRQRGLLVKRGQLTRPSFGASQTLGASRPGSLPVAEVPRCPQVQSLALGMYQL